MNKNTQKINGYMGINPENRAIVMIGDQWYMTPPVERYSVHGGVVYIETAQTIFTNMEV